MKSHMNGERLALYLRGDLSGADHHTVARHVESCSECQNTLADLLRSHELLVGCFEEPTPDELTAVRIAVAVRIQTRKRGSPWRIWTFAASAVVAFVILLANLRLQTPVPQPHVPPVAQPLIVKTSPPPTTVRKVEISRARHRRIVPGARTMTLLTRAEQPAWLKINTSDPDVVILWQLNENEKAETP
jgi:hypothetical protein